MIRGLILAGATVAVLNSPALAQPPRPPGPPPGGPMMGGPMRTHDYVDVAARTDQFEIAEARMALHRSSNPHVREFAQMMIHDHMDSTRMIKHAIARSGHPIPPPPSLSPEQQTMMDKLRAAAADFDRVYIDQQIHVHERALQVHQGYAQGGDDPALRKAAQQIVPVVQHHLDMARGIQSHIG